MEEEFEKSGSFVPLFKGEFVSGSKAADNRIANTIWTSCQSTSVNGDRAMRIQTRKARFSNDVYLHEFYTFIPENDEEAEILSRIIRDCDRKRVGFWLNQVQKDGRGRKSPEFVALGINYFGKGRWPGYQSDSPGPHLGLY